MLLHKKIHATILTLLNEHQFLFDETEHLNYRLEAVELYISKSDAIFDLEMGVTKQVLLRTQHIFFENQPVN